MFHTRVTTFNIRNTTDRYDERKTHMSESIKSIDSDIVGFQEVAWSQINRLKKSIGVESTALKCYCENPILSNSKSDYRVDGDLIIFRNKTKTDIEIKVLDHQYEYLSFERSVQKAYLECKKDGIIEKIWVLNTHLHNGVKEKDFNERLCQIKHSYEWLIKSENYKETDKIIFMGDFNSIPGDKSYNFMLQNGFKSCYYDVHKNEPTKTFPSGLIAPTMDKDEEGCIDFIWIRGDIKVTDSGLSCNLPLQSDNTIYPSDHFAVWADIVF